MPASHWLIKIEGVTKAGHLGQPGSREREREVESNRETPVVGEKVDCV